MNKPLKKKIIRKGLTVKMISVIKKIIDRIKKVLDTFQEHRINAAAAHAAYFIMLSFIPCIILLFSLLQFTSIRKTDVLIFVQNMVPKDMVSFATGIIYEAYSKTATTVSVSALMTLWSAGRGMMALTQGLQGISGIKETRNYFAVRIRATLYTMVLLLSIIVFLLLGVFGNSLLELITIKFPIATYVANMILEVKNIFLLLFAVVIFTLIYRFMSGGSLTLSQQMPGAALTSVGWFVFSYAFSIYVDEFSGFSNMYGSLTTIVLIMLWLYFGMYITLIGAEVNQLLVARWEKT